MNNRPLAISLTLCVGLTCLACDGGTIAPEGGGDRCVIKKVRGDMLVMSQVDGYAMMLAGSDWKISCPVGSAVAMVASDPTIGMIVVIGAVADTKDTQVVYDRVMTSLIERATTEWGLSEPRVETKSISEDGRAAQCVSGVIQLDAGGGQLYGCNTVKQRLDGTFLATSVLSLSPAELWNEHGASLRDIVQGMSGAWWLGHEIANE